MTAINPKNQKLVNKAIKWLIKYNEFNDQRDIIENSLIHSSDETTATRRINKKCEDSYNKYLEICEELPKREVKNIEKKHF